MDQQCRSVCHHRTQHIRKLHKRIYFNITTNFDFSCGNVLALFTFYQCSSRGKHSSEILIVLKRFDLSDEINKRMALLQALTRPKIRSWVYRMFPFAWALIGTFRLRVISSLNCPKNKWARTGFEAVDKNICVFVYGVTKTQLENARVTKPKLIKHSRRFYFCFNDAQSGLLWQKSVVKTS